MSEIINNEKQEEYISHYDSSRYEKPSVAVDLLVFTIEEDELKIVTIRRKEHPFRNELALPGVFVRIDENLDEAAARGIREETGLKDIYFEQLYTWGDINRDPRMRIISVSYAALVPIEKLRLTTGERTKEAGLHPVSELLEEDVVMAFDHKKIIHYGRERLKNKVEYTNIAFELVPEEFTLPQLQNVYEILLDKSLYKANFRKKIADMVEETDRTTTGNAHRPSKYYRLRK